MRGPAGRYRIDTDDYVRAPELVTSHSTFAYFYNL
jgi:hypothetical protein